MDMRLVGGTVYMAIGVHLEGKSHAAHKIIQTVHISAQCERRLICCLDLMVEFMF
jgi:hypothetical protein